MAKARLSMRKIKETLRLSYQCGLSRRQVARSVKASRSTVADYLYRAERAGIGWPLPEDLTDQELEQRLFLPQATPVLSAKPLLDFDYIYQELKAHKKFNLTLDLLWREYKEQHPEGYQYSQFCDLYRRWRGKLDYCMRQDHRGGEKLFVDYGAGLWLIPKAANRFQPSFLSRFGRFQLHLRRSDFNPATARLDRLSYQSVSVFRWCAESGGAGLS